MKILFENKEWSIIDKSNINGKEMLILSRCYKAPGEKESKCCIITMEPQKDNYRLLEERKPVQNVEHPWWPKQKYKKAALGLSYNRSNNISSRSYRRRSGGSNNSQDKKIFR